MVLTSHSLVEIKPGWSSLKVVQEKGICFHHILGGEIIEGLWPHREWGAVGFKVIEGVSAESGGLAISSPCQGGRRQQGLVDVQFKKILAPMQQRNVYFILIPVGCQ